MAFPTESGDPKLCGGIWGFGIFDNGDEAKIEAAKTFIDFIAADPDQVGASVLASTYFPVRESVGDIYAGNDIMSEYTKFMGFLGDYYQITPGWSNCSYRVVEHAASALAPASPLSRPLLPLLRTQMLPLLPRHKRTT